MDRWDVTVREATEIQKQLRKRLVHEPLPHHPRTIAGADISFIRYSKDLFAAVVVLSLPDLQEVERMLVRGVASFPYVPGYLSFREIPLLIEAFAKLRTRPDVVMADGQGIAHPRRMGLAAHLGLVLDIPAFGCAKSVLYGEAEPVAEARGSTARLNDPKTGDRIGAFVRTKDSVAPVIVSVGHRITLAESIALSLATARYRIPEPTRRAHVAVNQFRRGEVRA